MAAGGPIYNRRMSAITRPHGPLYLRRLHRIEGFLYCADNANSEFQERGASALAELGQVSDDASGMDFLVISRRARNANQRQLDQIRQAILDGRDLFIDGKVLGSLAALIDTYQIGLRG